MKMEKIGRFTVAEYLDHYISASGKTQREIAEEAGFESVNMVTMLKQGRTKLPIERVPALANALGISPRYLMALVLQEYHPSAFRVIQEATSAWVTDNEASIINFIRLISGRSDPGLGSELAREKLREAFGVDRS